MKARAIVIAALLALAGCGGSDDGDRTSAAPEAAPEEASPEAPATGPEVIGDVPEPERGAVTAAVSRYVDALNRHDAAGVCALFVPGALDLRELPRRSGGCEPSMRASIGSLPRGGGRAWRTTELIEAKAVALGDDRARATATVVHRFRDRRQPSIEEDVIYLDRVGDRWLLAKPSATFYRAVGYGDPPLRALTPP
jgi:hypothetical protein